jgi:hypothetical protein
MLEESQKYSISIIKKDFSNPNEYICSLITTQLFSYDEIKDMYLSRVFDI